ncbi:MAG: class I SAM-dependent methyltransferase [Spirochaeta sp.]
MAASTSPYSYPALYACQHREQLQDLPFYTAAAAETGPRILELGCGTGRLSIPLAEAGFSVVGVDLDARMLEYADSCRSRLPVSVRRRLRFVQMDVCNLQLSETFDLIIFPYHSLGHIPPGAPLSQLAGGIARHIGGNGRCILSLLQPDEELCRPVNDELRHLEHFTGPDNLPVDCYETTGYSADTRTVRFDWYYAFENNPDLLHICNELYVHRSDDIQQSFARHGLLLESRYGDFDFSPYREDSPELLQVFSRFH